MVVFIQCVGFCVMCMGVLFSVWGVCIIRGFCIICGSVVYCVGASYNGWACLQWVVILYEVCVFFCCSNMCGSFV